MKKLLIIFGLLLQLTANAQSLATNYSSFELIDVYDSATGGVFVMYNHFTPNGDSVNDNLFVTFNEIDSFNLLIVNNEDEVIYNYHSGGKINNYLWDGIHQAGKYKGQIIEGYYNFKLSVTMKDGFTIDRAGIVFAHKNKTIYEAEYYQDRNYVISIDGIIATEVMKNSK